MPYEKMSKSRGNVVTVDEVIYGVHELRGGHEFRDAWGEVIEDYRAAGVWQDRSNSGMFFTSTLSGKCPIFLHEVGNPMPAVLRIDGEERTQHPTMVLVKEWQDEDGNRKRSLIHAWEIIAARISGELDGAGHIRS